MDNLIGRGGMASVYLAYQESLSRYVAVKVLRGALVQDRTFFGRFQREAKALGQLRHPHIVSVYDFDREDDLLYIVMEYVESGSLAQQVGKPMPLEKVSKSLNKSAAA